MLWSFRNSRPDVIILIMFGADLPDPLFVVIIFMWYTLLAIVYSTSETLGWVSSRNNVCLFSHNVAANSSMVLIPSNELST
jgi:hypothetical protein